MPFLLLMIKMLIILLIYISNLIAYKTVFPLELFSAIKTVGYKRAQNEKNQNLSCAVLSPSLKTHFHTHHRYKKETGTCKNRKGMTKSLWKVGQTFTKHPLTFRVVF